MVPFKCGSREQVRGLAWAPAREHGPHPGPTWRPHPGPRPDPSGGGTATAEVPGQGLRREVPFFGASGPSAAKGLREDPARSPCGSAPSHQLLRGHERPVGGHRQGHLAGAVTPGAVTPQNHRSIRRQSQFWSRENLLKISNSWTKCWCFSSSPYSPYGRPQREDREGKEIKQGKF